MAPSLMVQVRAVAARIARKTLSVGVFLLLMLGSSCKDSFVPNLNDPELTGAVTTLGQIQAQVSGLLAGDREQQSFQILVLETMGRDAYRIDVADPRYLDMPFGEFNPGAFLADFPYNVHYRAIRGAQALYAGIDAGPFTTEQKSAVKGFARTLEAMQYMALINTRGNQGLPIQTGSGTLDPIRCEPAVLTHIATLLDEGATLLAAGGSSFPFTLPTGFTAFGTFNTPATFRTFNRALAAKNLRYLGFVSFAANGTKNTTALTAAAAALTQSFENFTNPATLTNGVYHTYSTASGDLENRNFDRSVIRVNPRVLAEADPGDARVTAKTQKSPSFLLANSDNSVTSDIIFLNVTGPTSPIPIIRNAELVLLDAEIQWGLGNYTTALARSNFVRVNEGGLAPRTEAQLGGFGTAAGQLNLLREILKQKRYSLLFESDSRLVDYRLYGLFPELGAEKGSTNTPQVIPFPQSEIDARQNNLVCTA
jgi:hypothetical protein